MGKPTEDLVGKTDHDLFPPELADAYRRDDLRVMESGTPLNQEEEHQNPGREKDYVQVMKVPSFDDQGRVTGVMGIFWDISERRQTEEALQASQKRYADLVTNLEGIVWEMDARTWRFRFVSPQAERILGYPVSRWIAEPNFWQDHLHPDDREAALKYCVECTRQARDHDFEYRMLAADGRVVWLHDLVTVESVAGEVVTLRGLVVDISERKRTEERLRESEQRFRLFMDQSPVVAWVKDDQYQFRYVNAAFEKLFALPADQILGRTDYELYLKDSADQTRANDRVVLDSGMMLEAIEQVPGADGRMR
jgi:PAS domain S-box-containing protein